MAAEIKKIARFFGASLCGITEYDERWTYESRVDVRDFTEAAVGLPEGLEHVVVLGHEMDEGLVATYPSALAGAATGREYSHEAAIVMQLAAYIRALGYNAVASMNDTALAIPYALKAGLGEYARNQLVITPETGPRLRFSKIFTDLPLAHDAPRKLGVAEFWLHLHALCGCLPGEGPALWPAKRRSAEPVRHPGRGEMDLGCGEVLRILGEAGFRLRNLPQGMPVQPGLPPPGQPALAPPRAFAAAPAGALARRPFRSGKAAAAPGLVGRGRVSASVLPLSSRSGCCGHWRRRRAVRPSPQS